MSVVLKSVVGCFKNVSCVEVSSRVVSIMSVVLKSVVGWFQ